MLILSITVISVALICTKLLKLHKHWKTKGIRYMKPWPFFGYMAPATIRFKSYAHVLQDVYETFPEQRYFGCYQYLTPYLVVRDPELMQQIMQGELERRNVVDPEIDPIWSKNLYVMKGDEQWQTMRSMLSLMFSDNEMENLFFLIKQCALNFIDHISTQKKDLISLELSDVTNRFVSDVIASAVFGTDNNSFINPTNDFYRKSKSLTQLGLIRRSKLLLHTVWPRLAKFLKIRLYNNDSKVYYENLLKNVMETRQNTRSDLVQFLLEIRKKKLLQTENREAREANFKTIEVTDEMITIQCLLFFFMGFETVSIATSHLIYELALNQEIQNKLRLEIDRNREGTEISYKSLMGLKYLDMVISETLRKWPPTMVAERKSLQSFTIEPKKIWESTVCFESGTLYMFPIYAIQRDPKNYPDPEKFDPERFNEENRQNIKPCTYIPFGMGPRSCIGSRFALLEMKTFVFYLLSNFVVVPIERTKIPLVLSRKTYNPVPDNGFWVGLKRRSH